MRLEAELIDDHGQLLTDHLMKKLTQLYGIANNSRRLVLKLVRLELCGCFREAARNNLKKTPFHNYRYYVLNEPVIADVQYIICCCVSCKLLRLSIRNDHSDSPTQRWVPFQLQHLL